MNQREPARPRARTGARRLPPGDANGSEAVAENSTSTVQFSGLCNCILQNSFGMLLGANCFLTKLRGMTELSGGHGWPCLDWLVRTRGSQICNALCPIAPPCEWRTRPQRQSLAAHQPRLAVAHANRKLPHLIPSNCKPVKQPKKDANMDINRTSGKPTAVQAHVRAALSTRPEKKEHRQ